VGGGGADPQKCAQKIRVPLLTPPSGSGYRWCECCSEQSSCLMSAQSGSLLLFVGHPFVLPFVVRGRSPLVGSDRAETMLPRVASSLDSGRRSRRDGKPPCCGAALLDRFVRPRMVFYFTQLSLCYTFGSILYLSFPFLRVYCSYETAIVPLATGKSSKTI